MSDAPLNSIVKRPIGVKVDLELTLRGPVLVTASESGPWGTDVICLRDDAGHLIIPGSLLKGLYRESLENLELDPWKNAAAESTVYSRSKDKGTDSILDRFASQNDSDERQQRSLTELRFPVDFSDFRAAISSPSAGDKVVAMTAMNENGTAKSGSLRFVDCPVAHGDMCCFRGTVTALCENEDDAFEFAYQVRDSFFWHCETSGISGMQVPAIGQNKSTGFGEIVDAQIKEVRTRVIVAASHVFEDIQPTSENISLDEPEGAASTSIPVDSRRHPMPTDDIYNGALYQAALSMSRDRALETPEYTSYPLVFDVEWQVLDPFCLAERTINGNVFESTDSIGGDILKGALARLLKEALGVRDDLTAIRQHPICQLFGDLAFTTAMPHGNTIVPHSVVVTSNSVVDLALPSKSQSSPDVIPGDVPRFFLDWKSTDQKRVCRYYPQIKLKRQLRVRTAVETVRRQAKNEQLFATRVVIPTGHIWKGQIVWNAKRETEAEVDQFMSAMHNLLDLLDSELMVIGKTGARIKGKVSGWSSFESMDMQVAEILKSGKEWTSYVVVLQTPALLLDWWQLVDKSGLVKNQGNLNSAYSEVFEDLSDGVFKLERFYASHELVGGHRAWSVPRKDAAEAYNPILLTSPGSTFILKEKKGDADARRRVLRRWKYGGLKPARNQFTKAVESAYGTGINNRYVTSNGYAAVTINNPRHQELAAE